MKKLIRVLYDSRFEVWIFNLSPDNLQIKLFSPAIISISFLQSSGKSAIHFTKTGEDGLIGTISSISPSSVFGAGEFVE